MQLYNYSQDKILNKHLKIANSVMDNIKGLIFAKPNQSLLIKTRWGIHTFMMKFALTVLICTFDKKQKFFKVKKIKKNLKPWRIFFYNIRYAYIFELPDQKYAVKIGDRLIVKN